MKKVAVPTVLIVILLVVFAGWRITRLRPNLKQDDLASDVTKLLTQAGGVHRVCEEADQMFIRFGSGQLRLLSESEINEYPAIKALGNVDGIWPDSRAYIKIRVGTHLNGYVIQILSTNSSFQRDPDTIEVVKSRIYVHR